MSLFSLLSLSWLLEVFYSLVCAVACYVVLYGADVFSGLFLDAAASHLRFCRGSVSSVQCNLITSVTQQFFLFPFRFPGVGLSSQKNHSAVGKICKRISGRVVENTMKKPYRNKPRDATGSVLFLSYRYITFFLPPWEGWERIFFV